MGPPLIEISGGATIGGDKTFVIAEIGSNHGGDLARARECIAAASEAGADAIKFQSINLHELYADPAPQTRALHEKIDLAEDWHAELKAACDSRGTIFFSSPTYLKAVDLLESIDVVLYKLASAQIGTFPQLVQKVAALGKPTLLSTGLVGAAGLERAIKYFREEGNEDYVILHCNSIYPTPPERVCLERMDVWRSLFNCQVGFSDHTEGLAIPLAAVARGATVIEKHFCLSRSDHTPDAFFSLEPPEFAELVRSIRDVEAAGKPCGPRLDIEPEERTFKEAIRYRLVLRRDKEAGDYFDPGDFDYKRHPEGVDCQDEELILNRLRAARAIHRGEVLQWSMVEGR